MFLLLFIIISIVNVIIIITTSVITVVIIIIVIIIVSIIVVPFYNYSNYVIVFIYTRERWLMVPCVPRAWDTPWPTVEMGSMT